MFYTYVLLCIDKNRKRRKFYIGSTDNLEKRILAHQSKSVKTTKSFDIIELVYYEASLNKTDARKRELQLKTGFGRGYLKRRIENYLKNVRVQVSGIPVPSQGTITGSIPVTRSEMTIHNPPQYRYSLFEPWDKDTFDLIKQIGKTKIYPELMGSPEDKNKYIIALIRTQKSLHDWRDFLKDTFAQIKQAGSIDTKLLNEKYPAQSIDKGVPDWVTYKGDKLVNDFIDELETRKIAFIGTDKEMSEFVMRYMLGQLGMDWEQTIYMIWEMLGEEDKLSIKGLNEEMKNFDYLKIFA